MKCTKWKKHPKKTATDIVAHFQKRCEERIGIILNQRLLKGLMSEGKLQKLEKQSNIKTKFLLKKEVWNGRQLLQFDVVVVYDKARHAFVTTWKAQEQNEMQKNLETEEL